MTLLKTYEQALPQLAHRRPRPPAIRTEKAPGDKVIVSPALALWRKTHPEKGRS